MTPVKRFLRILLKVVTVFSLAALLAVLCFWARAQWTSDTVSRYAVTDDPRRVRVTETMVATTPRWIGILYKPGWIDLSTGPAATRYRAELAARAGWQRSTRPPPSIAVGGAGWERYSGFAGLYWKLDPPVVQGGSPGRAFDPGWRRAQSHPGSLSVPWWLLALASSLLPTLALRRWLRDRRRDPSACEACGYDLRATPDRCPECGNVPKPAGGMIGPSGGER